MSSGDARGRRTVEIIPIMLPVRLRGDSGGGVGVPAIEIARGFLPILSWGPGRGCILKPFVGLLGRGSLIVLVPIVSKEKRDGKHGE
jgi:hypothetical protein